MTALLKGLKIAILIANGFEQIEMTEPKKALEEVGALVHIVSPEQGKVKGWHWDIPQEGDEFPVDVPLGKANAKDYDALVLPGGLSSPDDLRLNDKAISFIQEFANKPIAAICHGPWLLIDANLVYSKTVTSWPSIKKDLENAGATWLDQEVVQDDNLVTSRMPDDIKAFNKAMITLFSKAPTRQKPDEKEKSVGKAYTVIVTVEAKSGKEAELKQALAGVVEPSRSEKTCLEYRLHQDLNNPAQFVLYENWQSKEAHQQQFQKPYIISLVKELDDLLAKPYQAIFAEQVS